LKILAKLFLYSIYQSTVSCWRGELIASYSDNRRGVREFPVALLTVNFSLMIYGLMDQSHIIEGCHIENGC